MKQVFYTVGLDILHIINNRLLTEISPACFKLDTVTPILKKLSLGPAVYANYRPISNLSLLSKILEKRSLYSFNIIYTLIQFLN